MPNTPASDQNDACQLKAGHPPAVKVGNMRVVQRTHSTSSTHSDKGDNKNETSETVPVACSFAPKTDVSEQTDGVPASLAKSVPAEAMKQIHEKPQPAHDYRGHSNKPNVIQQPKK